MSLTIKIAIFAAVVVAELVVTAFVGLRMANQGRAPIALALAMSAVVTIVVLGYVLFFVLD